MAKQKNAKPKTVRQKENGGVGDSNSPAVFNVPRGTSCVVKFRGKLVAISNEDVTRHGDRVIPKATQAELQWFYDNSEYWARHIERVEVETDNEDGGNTIAEQYSEGQPVTEGETSEGEGV